MEKQTFIEKIGFNRFIRNRSIREKLLLMSLAISLFAMILAGSTFIIYQKYSLSRLTINNLRSHAGLIGENVKGALSFDDPLDAELLLRSLQESDDITAGAIYNEKKIRFAEWHRDGSSPLPLNQGYTADHELTDKSLFVVDSIMIDNQLLGVVVLRSHQEQMTVFLRQGIISSLLSALLIVLATIILSTWLQKPISDPIQDLSNFMNQISDEKDFGARTTYASEDEIGQLALHLNEMLAQIEKINNDLRASEELLQETGRVANVGGWEVYVDDMIPVYSAQTLEIFGYSDGEQPDDAPDFSNYPEDARKVIRDAVERLITMGDSYDLELPFQTVDGDQIWIRTIGKPHYKDDRIFRVGGTVQDITARKKLEDSNRQSQKMEAIGRLAGGVAHDFNNLLTAITGNAELALIDLPPESPAREDITEILETADRAARLTRQLLAFGRKQIVEIKQIDLNSAIDGMEKMLSRLLTEEIHLIIDKDQLIGLVAIDPTQVEQIIINLVVNARDAMPEGGKIIVKTEAVDSFSNPSDESKIEIVKPCVRVSVIDEGIGLDEELMAHIFEPFYTTKDTLHGTGLGLATVYGIVEQAEGTIEVESELGEGTTFYVNLPVSQSSQPTIMRTELDQPHLHGKEQLLIVDDNQSIRSLLTRSIKLYGYSVEQADGFGQARDIYERKKNSIALIITDVIMPEIGGPEMIERLEAAGYSAQVLYMSGHAEHDIVSKGNLLPGINFISKPFSTITLVTKIRSILDS